MAKCYVNVTMIDMNLSVYQITLNVPICHSDPTVVKLSTKHTKVCKILHDDDT